MPQEIGAGSVNALAIVALRAIILHANIMRVTMILSYSQDNLRNHQNLIITTGNFANHVCLKEFEYCNA